MLRRVAPRLMFFTTGSGTALRTEARASAAAPEASSDTDEPVGVYLPWTARPWEVTHRVQHAQWKFLDTVLTHLATLTPAELSERAREQGAGDVLCELEEPVMALRRQQARQARQLRRQEKAARFEAAATTVTPTAAAPHTPAAAAANSYSTDHLSSLMSESLLHATSTPSTSAGDASGPSALQRTAADGDTSPGTSEDAAVPSATDEDAAPTPEDATDVDAAAAENRDATRSKGGTSKGKKKSKKPKRVMKSVEVIHYL